MSESRYFELLDHVGVTADGNPEPLVQEAIALAVPVMAAGEVIDEFRTVYIDPADRLKQGAPGRILPGTRIIETANPTVAAYLLAHGKYQEVDKPSKKAEAHQRGEARAAAQEAGTHDEDPTTATVGTKGE